MAVIAIIAGSISGLIIIYLLLIRPWHLKWGATKQELSLSLPGDNLVNHPNFNATRGISIAATPPQIWKWIIQMGCNRAGFYSIDWIDNGGKKSSSEILPRYQTMEVGQFIPFTPDEKHGMWVKGFKEHEYILWADKDGNASWLWYLYQPDKENVKLITRLRTKYVWKGFWIIYYLIYDFGDIVMMRKCLKGIKKRAEKSIMSATNKSITTILPL